MGYGITYDYNTQDEKLKPYLVERLINYALNRVDPDIKALVVLKKYTITVDCVKESETDSLIDAMYQVNFTSVSGLRFSVDGIFINNKYMPKLDQGVSLAENQ